MHGRVTRILTALAVVAIASGVLVGRVAPKVLEVTSFGAIVIIAFQLGGDRTLHRVLSK